MSLTTLGVGTINFKRVFRIFSFKITSSIHQMLSSFLDAPAVGSGAPLKIFIDELFPFNSSSKSLCAVGSIYLKTIINL